MLDLQTTITREGDISIIYLSGHLNAATADQLTKILLGLINEGSHRTILEMGAVEYISSNGLRPLNEWLNQTQNVSGNRKLAICNLSDFVASVFEVTGYDRKFPVFENADAALESF